MSRPSRPRLSKIDRMVCRPNRFWPYGLVTNYDRCEQI